MATSAHTPHPPNAPAGSESPRDLPLPRPTRSWAPPVSGTSTARCASRRPPTSESPASPAPTASAAGHVGSGASSTPISPYAAWLRGSASPAKRASSRCSLPTGRSGAPYRRLLAAVLMELRSARSASVVTPRRSQRSAMRRICSAAGACFACSSPRQRPLTPSGLARARCAKSRSYTNSTATWPRLSRPPPPWTPGHGRGASDERPPLRSLPLRGHPALRRRRRQHGGLGWSADTAVGPVALGPLLEPSREGSARRPAPGGRGGPPAQRRRADAAQRVP